jgi:hypothetical protein
LYYYIDHNNVIISLVPSRLLEEYRSRYEAARREPETIKEVVQFCLDITASQEKILPTLAIKVDQVETLLEYLTLYGFFSDVLTGKYKKRNLTQSNNISSLKITTLRWALW